MSEMVERIAAAIQHRVDQPGQCSYDDMARAAIEAMRAPTEFMLNDNVTHSTASAPVRKIFWQEMIDRALNESGSIK